VKGRDKRRSPPFLLRQDPADLLRERAVVNKAQRGIALVVEAMNEAPDEYRRAFALCLALAQLSEAARSDMARAMLRAAAGLDMQAAPVPAFIQAAMEGVVRPSPA